MVYEKDIELARSVLKVAKFDPKILGEAIKSDPVLRDVQVENDIKTETHIKW